MLSSVDRQRWSAASHRPGQWRIDYGRHQRGRSLSRVRHRGTGTPSRRARWSGGNRRYPSRCQRRYGVVLPGVARRRRLACRSHRRGRDQVARTRQAPVAPGRLGCCRSRSRVGSPQRVLPLDRRRVRKCCSTPTRTSRWRARPTREVDGRRPSSSATDFVPRGRRLHRAVVRPPSAPRPGLPQRSARLRCEGHSREPQRRPNQTRAVCRWPDPTRRRWRCLRASSLCGKRGRH